jgi:hypothetical protein
LEARDIHFEAVVDKDDTVPNQRILQGERVRLLQNHRSDRISLFGTLRAKIYIREDFDDPIPGMGDNE